MRMGFFSALAIAIHNFPEGLATFMAAISEPQLGISIAVAIAIHNIPEGVAVSAPIYYATKSRKKAFWLSLLSGLAEPVGAFIGYFLLRRWFNDITFGFVFAAVAGIMVYISLDELLPTAEEYGEHHVAITGVIAGMVVMAVSLVMLHKHVIETSRLYLRELNQADYSSLAAIVQDEQTMYAYEGPFSDAETQAWLDKNILRYKQDGFGLWAVILRESGAMIGMAGLTWQSIEQATVLEIGYLLNRRYWGMGFAIEAAKACKEYAFSVLEANEVYSISDTNIASMNVAIRNGMLVRGRLNQAVSRCLDAPWVLCQTNYLIPKQYSFLSVPILWNFYSFVSFS